MTAGEALTRLDELYPNTLDAVSKLRELRDHDGVLWDRLRSRDWLPGEISRPDYQPDRPEQPLLIPDPYAGEVYENYLLMVLYRLYGETEHYNQALTLYRLALEGWLRQLIQSAGASGEHFRY